ncbi:UNVERIFIED_CONTAM: hypothetical protein Scaly_0554100, partial [Sesamum calycinum]
MRQRPKGASSKSNLSGAVASGETSNRDNSSGKVNNVLKDKNVVVVAKRSSYVLFTLFVLAIYGAWVCHRKIETIKEKAHWEVDMEVDLFHAKYGANNLVGGLFKGKTLVYSDLNHVVLRIMPKYASEAGKMQFWSLPTLTLFLR